MRVWIDLDNSPHVHFFAPLIGRLAQNGIDPVITVRSFAQTVELARWYGFRFDVVGAHRTPRYKLARVAATVRRATQLIRYMYDKKATAALSHGSRALLLAARALGIPAATFYDYEFVSSAVFHRFSQRVFVPEVIPTERLAEQGARVDKLVRYPGLKEEVYIYDFRPNPAVLQTLTLDPAWPIITVRPPATWAHYHTAQSEKLFDALMHRLGRETGAQVVVLPRTWDQAEELRERYALRQGPFRFLEKAVDGLSLLSYSDFVFGGGGTMSREAAFLGVKTYSIFGGRLGAADESLERAGRLILLRNTGEIESLDLRKNGAVRPPPQAQKRTQQFLLEEILRFVLADGLQ